MARVLIVDDDQAYRIILGRILEGAGHDVYLTSDDELALKILLKTVPATAPFLDPSPFAAALVGIAALPSPTFMRCFHSSRSGLGDNEAMTSARGRSSKHQPENCRGGWTERSQCL